MLAGTVSGRPSGNQREINLHARQTPTNHFFDSQRSINFTGLDSIHFEIQLRASSLCPKDLVSDYLQPNGMVLTQTTIATMLQGLTDAGATSDWPKKMVLDTIDKAKHEAEKQLINCISSERDPTSPSTLDAIFGPESFGPSGGSVPITQANRGAITTTLTKLTGIPLAAGLSFTPALGSNDEAQVTVVAIAAGVSTVLYYQLTAIVDWIKNQNDFNAYDAAMLKLFGDWANRVLKKTGEIHTCPSDSERKSAMESFKTADSTALDDFDLLSNQQVEDGDKNGACRKTLE